MRRKILISIVAAASIGLAGFWLITRPAMVPASALAPRVANLENGKTMFFAGGCASCHATPGQGDKMKLGGGLALKSPFGTFYAPNISPDPSDGIGRWGEADFVTAMVKGASPDGQHLYPAFPYTTYRKARIDDIRDLFAFLKTLPMVQAKSKAHDLPFPFSIRRSLGAWKLLFLGGETIEPNPAKDAVWNRGAYLVNALAHCAECHSPRNVLGAVIEGQRFAGGPEAIGDGWVPNITQEALSKWSVEQIARLLESGELPDADSVGGEMGKVVANTARLSEADRMAIATYIKSLPPVKGPKPPPGK